MSPAKLKPCPFCGAEVKDLMVGITSAAIHDPKCFFYTQTRTGNLTVLKRGRDYQRWNRRIGGPDSSGAERGEASHKTGTPSAGSSPAPVRFIPAPPESDEAVRIVQVHPVGRGGRLDEANS